MSKNECPICFEIVDENNNLNCLECMTCFQKIHTTCEIKWNTTRIPQSRRLLRDDILICPVCKQDSISYCFDPTDDINKDIKDAVSQNPNKRGGKLLKNKSKKFTKRLKKNKRLIRSRKTKSKK